MRALIPTGRPGAPVAFHEIPEPTPGPGEALVRVDAFSPNRGELFLLNRPPDGWRPGKDIAGLVVQAAADGSGPRVGRRVVGHPPSGGWAEYAAVPVDRLTEVPDEMPAVEAAALPLAGLTALRLIRTAGCVAGQRVLVTGASGGVGHYLVELLAGAGAEVTAVSRRGDRLTALGARTVVPDIAEVAGTFRTAFESVGGTVTPAVLSRVEPRGTMIWFGQVSREPVTLNFFDFFKGPESGTIRHFHYEHFDEPVADDLERLVKLVQAGRLHPEVGRTADWSDSNAVLGEMAARTVRGNAVLTVGGTG